MVDTTSFLHGYSATLAAKLFIKLELTRYEQFSQCDYVDALWSAFESIIADF